jgi:hypothetical protein
MKISANVYRTAGVGINAPILKDNHGRKVGVALYLNLFFVGFGFHLFYRRTYDEIAGLSR